MDQLLMSQGKRLQKSAEREKRKEKGKRNYMSGEIDQG